MARRDDGLMLKNNGCPDGVNDLHRVDNVKCYTAVGIERNEPWIIPTFLDCWRDFDFITDHEIPYGEYILHEGIYGDERTLIMYDRGIHTSKAIRHCLSMKYITFNDIKKIRPV